MRQFFAEHWNTIIFPIIIMIVDYLISKSKLKGNSLIEQIWKVIKRTKKK
jgi:hypothetical protein